MAVSAEDETLKSEVVVNAPTEIDLFVEQADSGFVSDNLPTLIGAGANAEALLDKLSTETILQNATELISAGVSHEVILSKMKPFEAVKAYKEVIAAGLVVDPEWLTKFLPDWMDSDDLYAVDFYNNLDGVLALGVKPDDILPYIRRNRFYPSILLDVAKRFIDRGADLPLEEVNQAIEAVQGTYHTMTVIENLRDLVSLGANIDTSTFVEQYNRERLDGGKLIRHIEEIITVCGEVNVDELIKNAAPIDVQPKLRYLIKLGADAKILAEHITREKVEENLEWFIGAYKRAGYDVDELVTQGHNQVLENVGAFIEAGASKDLVLSRINGYWVLRSLQELLENGFTIDDLVGRLDSRERIENYGMLTNQYGAEIDLDPLLDRMLDNQYDYYLKHEPAILTSQLKFLLKHLKTLQNGGADIRKITAQPEIQEILDRIMTDEHKLTFTLAELKAKQA